MQKIGLITPYTGSNLGDGAIQEGMIQNIRKRYPDAKIYGFTTWPEETEKLHKINSFPITAVIIPGYSATLLKKKHEIESDPTKNSNAFKRAKEKIKRNRYIYLGLKIPYALFKGIFKGIPMVFGEALHIIKSYIILKRFDLLIVSGGGQIDDYWGGPMGHPYSLFKWALLAKASNVRFIILSVGVCSMKSKISHFFIENALKLAEYRSYRDQKSKDMLKNLPFTHKDKVYPDLAFSYGTKKNDVLPRETNKKKDKFVVGINPIAYLSQYNWPTKNIPVFDAYLNNLAAFIIKLIGLNYSILVFPTDSPDRLVVRELITRLKDACETTHYHRISEPPILTVDDLLNHLTTVDYVVASRLHAILLSHLMNKPVLAISYDRKVNTYMEETHQKEYCLDIHTFDVANLFDTFGLLSANAGKIKAEIKKKIQNYKLLLEDQYNQLLKE